jgi:hypothetical protein
MADNLGPKGDNGLHILGCFQGLLSRPNNFGIF